jgi:hypothetical protein
MIYVALKKKYKSLQSMDLNFKKTNETAAFLRENYRTNNNVIVSLL